MPDAIDIFGSAFKNGSLALLARLVGAEGTAVRRADIDTITYTVYLLDDTDADSRTPVTGHTAVALPVAEILFDAIQLDPIWTVDTTGYNFRHVLDVSAHPAFTIAGRRYLVEHRLTPAVGQVIIVRFRINVI
jgi:hypothetical protein